MEGNEPLTRETDRRDHASAPRAPLALACASAALLCGACETPAVLLDVQLVGDVDTAALRVCDGHCTHLCDGECSGVAGGNKCTAPRALAVAKTAQEVAIFIDDGTQQVDVDLSFKCNGQPGLRAVLNLDLDGAPAPLELGLKLLCQDPAPPALEESRCRAPACARLPDTCTR